jgi:hypothetical protein
MTGHPHSTYFMSNNGNRGYQDVTAWLSLRWSIETQLFQSVHSHAVK